MSAENSLKRQIIRKKRRLQLLKEQQAVKGVNTDPEILIEIEDIEVELVNLWTELTTLEKTQRATTFFDPVQVEIQELKSDYEYVHEQIGLVRRQMMESIELTLQASLEIKLDRLRKERRTIAEKIKYLQANVEQQKPDDAPAISEPDEQPTEMEIPTISETSPTEKFTLITPSWVEAYDNIQPVSHDDVLSRILKGYSPFSHSRAKHELPFLFGDAGGFWSGHPVYAAIAANLQPQVILAETGGGKSAFAHALRQIGNVDGTPLSQTLPVLLTQNNPITLKNAKREITEAILNFIQLNPIFLTRLNTDEQEYVIRFLLNQLSRERVKLKLSQIFKQSKRLTTLIGQIPETAQPTTEIWLRRAQDVLQSLHFRRVLLIIDANRQSVARVNKWLNNSHQWNSYAITPILFLPLERQQEFDLLLRQANVQYLTWTEKQLTQMAIWRFEAIARHANIRIPIETLFDDNLFSDFIRLASGNPGRLAQLWAYMFENHHWKSPTRRAFSLDDLGAAVEKLT